MKRHRAYVATVAVVVGLTAAAGFLAAGCEMCCNSSQGRGSIHYTDPLTKDSGKATFAYRVDCDGSYSPDGQRTVRGRLAYHDQKPWKKTPDSEPKIVRIHGKTNNVIGGEADYQEMWSLDNYSAGEGEQLATFFPPQDYDVPEVCSAAKPNLAAFKGKYVPQPGNLGDGGEFVVIVEDRGNPGPSPEDVFSIKLLGGVFDGYYVNGLLAPGGKINPL